VSPLLVGLSDAVGAAGGALVPLTAYRLSVPAEEPDRDACISCARPLPAGIRGWLGLPARCAGCGVRLGPPAWLTALMAGVASGILAAALDAMATPGGRAVLALYVPLAVLGVLLTFIDIACKRLPHRLVVPAIWISAVLFAVIAAGTGEWGAMLRAGLGALVLGAIFLGLYLIPGQGLGYGDVKLAVLLGLYLGWLGWTAVALGALLPWLVNGPVVLALLVARRVDRRTSLPFGPAMLAGSLLAILSLTGLPMFARV